jgi:hypothetical protein
MAMPANELDIDGVKIRLTNADEVYFPKLGSDGTKRKLVECYLAVASGPMLTALRDRPTHAVEEIGQAPCDVVADQVRFGRKSQATKGNR